MEHGADVNTITELPLGFAARNGHLEVVVFLIEHGAKINRFNDTVLRWAINNGHLNVLKYLIEKGASITHARKLESLARQRGHIEMADYLKGLA